MVSDVISTTKKNINLNKIKNLNNIYRTKHQLVKFSQNMQMFDKEIKNFLKQKMYFHRNVKSKTNYGRKVITRLFFQIKKNPQKYINIKKYSNSNIERIICDYIAGMTDRYAINLYNQIK
jgi:dGTPase